jgi:hypothetical protein
MQTWPTDGDLGGLGYACTGIHQCADMETGHPVVRVISYVYVRDMLIMSYTRYLIGTEPEASLKMSRTACLAWLLSISDCTYAGCQSLFPQMPSFL